MNCKFHKLSLLITIAFLGVSVLFIGKVNSEDVDPNIVTSVVVELKDSTFDEQVIEANTASSTRKWFVKFYAPWCGHCIALTPKWDELSLKVQNDHPEIMITKIDCTKNGDICKRYGVKGFPTLKLFTGGKVYDYNKKKRTVDEFLNFAVSGYKNETGKSTLPPSAISKFLTNLRVDIHHVQSQRPYGGLLILLLGIINGITVLFFLNIHLYSKRLDEKTNTTSTTEKVKATKKE
mmetsp:Transcript_30518/g.33808  ORF Transcript_30518/g.33808 Transcript_30518/m.33808 type:complete len:235 (+) Transcript_30518:73-777(+)